jgi:predicted transcriptional regulator
VQQLIDQLRSLGFSEKEAAVYLACLELGEAPIQGIAVRSRVSRATTYLVLETLASRRLVEAREQQNRRTYRAESPERLRLVVEEEQRAIEEKRKGLEQAIPILLAMCRTEGARPHLQYLEGEEGLAAVRELFLEIPGDAFQIVPIGCVNDIESITKDRTAHLELFAKNGGSLRVLLIAHPEHLGALPKFPGVEWRVISPEKFPLRAEITVRGNTVFTFVYKERVTALVVTNKELAEAVQTLFLLAWKGAVGN